MKHRDEGEGVYNQLPGTGGDLRSRERFVDENDVEGHLRHRDGEGEELLRLPTTQGEFTKRGPGENPHGER